MNAFESFCQLASNEKWCWNLACTTCGHIHFRFSLLELAKGLSPNDKGWIIHRRRTSYANVFGPHPRTFNDEQQHALINICLNAHLRHIAYD